jgi:hypothetical protein
MKKGKTVIPYPEKSFIGQPFMKSHFDITLQAAGVMRDFHFLLISYSPDLFYPNQLWYHITVMNDDELLLFRMKRNEKDEWKIDNQVLPEWVFKAEPELGKTIENENSGIWSSSYQKNS